MSIAYKNMLLSRKAKNKFDYLVSEKAIIMQNIKIMHVIWKMFIKHQILRIKLLKNIP